MGLIGWWPRIGATPAHIHPGILTGPHLSDEGPLRRASTPADSTPA